MIRNIILKLKGSDLMARVFAEFAALDTCNLCGNYDTIQCWIDIAPGVFLHVCEECANSKTKKQLVNQLKKKYHYTEKEGN